jgi:hypothetical protein
MKKGKGGIIGKVHFQFTVGGEKVKEFKNNMVLKASQFATTKLDKINVGRIPWYRITTLAVLIYMALTVFVMLFHRSDFVNVSFSCFLLV